MRLVEERKKILEITDKLLAAGVIRDGHGNFSIFDRESGLVAITPSAVPYAQRGLEDICIVDLDGKLVEGKWKSTWETSLHLIYYRKREDINAVVHTHAPKATVFGVIGDEPMPMILNESAMGIGGSVPIAPYARPGTDELAEVTFEATGDGYAAVMAHHGLITVGINIDYAYLATMAVEATADTIMMAHLLGREPLAFSDQEVKILRDLFMEGYKPKQI
jgi:L-ribulose-5-phosphate 4-epimerase